MGGEEESNVHSIEEASLEVADHDHKSYYQLQLPADSTSRI